MTKPKSYRDLIVWQRGIELAKEIHKITKQFPKHETYALAQSRLTLLNAKLVNHQMNSNDFFSLLKVHLQNLILK